jgi:hypothetical protein
MKFPFILFFRYDKYKSIDTFLQDNCNKLNCTLHIINKKEKLNKLFKQTYPLLVVFGEKDDYKDDLSDLQNSNMSNRIIYISSIDNINAFNEMVNKFYINMCSLERVSTRPVFSIFTTTFNSFEKILRAFKSIQSQTLTNWEWVIVDDSPDDKNFQYLKQQLLSDNRVRIYKRFENNGYIGNVKNEYVSL